MKLKDLIKNKDYDYIEYRTNLPPKFGGGTTFLGACESKNGKLIPLDGDIYNGNQDVLNSEEWSNYVIKNGLTVFIITQKEYPLF